LIKYIDPEIYQWAISSDDLKNSKALPQDWRKAVTQTEFNEVRICLLLGNFVV